MLALLTNLPSAYLGAQLKDGLVVMVIGMLVVFLFLIILIGATKAMSKIVGKFVKPEEPKKKVAAAPVATVKDDDAKIAAAIAAAVDQTR
ncbi:MAG: OadG family protein [Prevotella sp.]|nr:OadG family protein [Spirochaetales bacterium]MDY5085581.1 OadG family protein [Prevotella sp.]